MDYRHDCAVCGTLVILDESNVCDNCGWEEDTLQEEEHDYRGGANFISLNEAKANYKECGKAMSSQAIAEKTAYWEAYYAHKSSTVV